MKYTSNLKLKKPDGTDVVSIDDLNDNADKVDLEIKKSQDNINSVLTKANKNAKDIVSVNAKIGDISNAELESIKEKIDVVKYSPPITTSDNVISLPDNTTKGQINMSIRGETRTNLIKKKDYSEDTDFHTIEKTDKYFEGRPIYTMKEKFNMSSSVTLMSNMAIKNGQTYTANIWIKVPATSDRKNPCIQFDSSSGVYSSDQVKFADRNNQDWQKITLKYTNTQEDLNNVRLRFCNSADKRGKITYFTYPMLERGDVEGNFITGTKSVIGSTRVTSVGKNLCPINNGELYKWIGKKQHTTIDREYYRQENNTSEAFEAALEFKLKRNKMYTLSATGHVSSDTFNDAKIIIGFFNESGGLIKEYAIDFNKNVDDVRKSITFTTPTQYCHPANLWFVSGKGCIYVKDIQIEEGDVATEYEPYKSDTSYLVAKDEDDKIVNLRSLPNGIADEIRQNKNREMKLIKKVSDIYTLKEEDFDYFGAGKSVMFAVAKIPDNCVNYNIGEGHKINVFDIPLGATISLDADDEKYIGTWTEFSASDKKIAFVLEKNTTPEDAKQKLVGTTLIYQLAEPEIIPLRWTGLNVEKNGTLYFDTIIPEIGFYYDNGLYSHAINHSIEKVDTLYKVDKQTGIHILLDTSKCEFREDRLSFTHPDLKDGDLCDWDYVSEGQYPNTEKTIIVPTNLKASVDSLLKDSQIQKENIRQFDSRLNGLATNIEENYVRFPCYVEKVTIGKTSSDNPMVLLYLPNDVKDYKEGQKFTFKMPTDIEGDKIYIGFADARYCYLIKNQDYESVTKLYKKVTYTATYNGDVFIIQGAESKDMTRDSINVQFSQTNEYGELDENDKGLYTVLLCGSRGWTDDVNTFPIGSSIVLALKAYMDITNDKIKIVINDHNFSFLKKPNGSFVTKLYRNGVYTFRWNGKNFILQGGESIDGIEKMKYGTSKFKGNNSEVTISHGLSVSPQIVHISPTQNPDGYLGEYWVRWDKNNIYVGNSGSFKGNFAWIAYF